MEEIKKSWKIKMTKENWKNIKVRERNVNRINHDGKKKKIKIPLKEL